MKTDMTLPEALAEAVIALEVGAAEQRGMAGHAMAALNAKQTDESALAWAVLRDAAEAQVNRFSTAAQVLRSYQRKMARLEGGAR